MDLPGSRSAIVITSIFPPTPAIAAFSKFPGYKIIVVGDKKTPTGWHFENVDYLSLEKQQEIGTNLRKKLPYNHYGRKMMGYLQAIALGAQYIVDTDDDNIPKADWGFPSFSGLFETIYGGQGFINIYQLFSDAPIWPRGLPLNLVIKKFDFNNIIKPKNINVGMWQGLADEDPDVDAIYRLTSNAPVYFKERAPVVLDKGSVCPFNTQNTIVKKQFFKLMYLPTYVTFRFTDILRSLVAQPIMWLYDHHLGFTNATVTQKRNPHDYFKDFVSEIPMYLHAENVLNITQGVVSGAFSLDENLHKTYEALLRKDIVEERELALLEAWLKDIAYYD